MAKDTKSYKYTHCVFALASQFLKFSSVLTDTHNPREHHWVQGPHKNTIEI